MNWKEFLKPTKWKIVIFVISVALASLLVLWGISVGIYPISQLIPRAIIALIVWYLVSCLIVFGYKKFKEKK
jgi:polyferredoxin